MERTGSGEESKKQDKDEIRVVRKTTKGKVDSSDFQPDLSQPAINYIAANQT